MCRMIIAHGIFNPVEILEGAIEMSDGRTARHSNPIRAHRNGWGVLLHHPGEKKAWTVHRSTSPLSECNLDHRILDRPCDLMIVHARHATLPKNIGIEFSHPLIRKGTPDWYFFHNGYLPTVHQKLGMPVSEFDSRQYFDYLIPNNTSKLHPSHVLTKLDEIGTGGTAGNAIAVNDQHAHVICWFPRESNHPDFYTMWSLINLDSTIISSEIIPSLGEVGDWRSIQRRTLVNIDLKLQTLGESR